MAAAEHARTTIAINTSGAALTTLDMRTSGGCRSAGRAQEGGGEDYGYTWQIRRIYGDFLPGIRGYSVENRLGVSGQNVEGDFLPYKGQYVRFLSNWYL